MRLAVGDNAWDRVRGSCVADYAAGRRTPCAGRAVILTAIQSLRRVVGRGATLYGVVVILVRVRMGGEFGGSRAGAQRYRGACSERGRVGRGRRAGAQRSQGRVRRGGRVRRREYGASRARACGERGLGWAGPAGWLRESGSRLPHSKAFGGGAGWERGW